MAIDAIDFLKSPSASIVKAQKENDDDMLSDLDKEVRDINDIEISV